MTCKHDERPAWELFTDRQATRTRVTQELLERLLPFAKRSAARPAAELEAAFETERAHERRILAYGEMYNGRHLAKLDLDALFARTPRERPLLSAAAADLYGNEVERLSEDWRKANEELAFIIRAQRGEVKRDALIVRGQLRAPSDVPELLRTCTDRMKAIDDAFAKLDQNVAEVHAELAISLGDDDAKKLRRRYAQCLRLARWQEWIGKTRQRALTSIGPILKEQQITADGVRTIADELGALGTAVSQVLKEAATKKPPRLPNVAKDSNLAQFLLAKPPVGPFRDESDLGHWMRVTMGQADEVVDKLGRLHTHAVSQLLAEQERVRDAFAQPSAAPADRTSEPAGEPDGDGDA